jgi:hypothetical protein
LRSSLASVAAASLLMSGWMLSCALWLTLASRCSAEIQEPEEMAHEEQAARAQQRVEYLASLRAMQPTPPTTITPTLPVIESGILDFDAQGRIVDPPSRRAASLRIDTWAAYLPRHPDIKLGLGLVLADSPHGPRASLQLGNGVIGLALGWKVIPVIDFTVGLGCLWSVQFDDLEPSVFFSFSAW